VRSLRYAGLHVLADDDRRWRIDPVEQAEAAIAGGARVVQLRAKHASDTQCLAWARAIRVRTRAADVAFVLNDRFDLAWLAEADAVHLGQDDLAPGEIPAPMRARLAVGRSTHTLDQARAAAREDVAYLAIGPVFGTASKQTPWSARGVELVREVVSAVAPIPVVAIGGVDASNLAAILSAGAVGAAVISAVAGAHDPMLGVRELVAVFAGHASDRAADSVGAGSQPGAPA
jgi:thiamine-phosphate pyrophosphorylase